MSFKSYRGPHTVALRWILHSSLLNEIVASCSLSLPFISNSCSPWVDFPLGRMRKNGLLVYILQLLDTAGARSLGSPCGQGQQIRDGVVTACGPGGGRLWSVLGLHVPCGGLPRAACPSLPPEEALGHQVALPPSCPPAPVFPNTATADLRQEFQKTNFCCPHAESSLIHRRPWPFI